MPKKIFDIFPPKKLPPTQPISPPEKERQAFFKKLRKPTLPPTTFFKRLQPSRLPPKGPLWWGVVLVLIFLGSFFSYFQLPRAEIEIWPETKILNLVERVTADSKTERIDLSKKIIPAKFFEEELTLSEEFLASGQKEKRAEGIIRVYNAYSTSPQVLVATTRFVSADGKLFRTPVRVTIAGGHYEKGKFIPGFTDILVRADQPGEEYNIGPSTFSIPGFAGTARYTTFYGKSFSEMSGGGIVSEVTKEDLAKAKKDLTNRAFEEGKASLKSKITPDFVLLDEGLSQEIIAASPTAEAGEEVSAFNFQFKVKSEALSFKKSDLEDLARELVISQMSPDQKLLAESLKTNWESESIDFKSGKIILNLALTAKIYSDIDQIFLKKGLQGKSLAETQILLENQPQITKFQAKLWPFWVKKVPENLEKIRMKLTVD